MGYFFDRALFGRETANTILAFRFLFGFIVFTVSMVAVVVFIIRTIYKEVALELNYQQKYGPAWKVEYERYHGSLPEEHTRLIVAMGGMLLLAFFLSWIGWRLLHKHRRHRSRA